MTIGEIALGVMVLFGLFLIIMTKIANSMTDKENRQKTEDKRRRLSVTTEIKPGENALLKLSTEGIYAEYEVILKHSGKTWKGSVKILPDIQGERQTRTELIQYLESAMLEWYRKNKI